MAIPQFLKQIQEQRDKLKESKKGDFRAKCVKLLHELKDHNEERYLELSKVFYQKYDKLNIQKKKILGFYALLKNELKQYQEETGIIISAQKQMVKKTTKKVATKVNQVKKNAEKSVKNAVKQVRKEVEEIKKVTKKVVKKAAPKKVAKKAAPKKVAKKAAPKKVAKKKVVKKKAKK